MPKFKCCECGDTYDAEEDFDFCPECDEYFETDNEDDGEGEFDD